MVCPPRSTHPTFLCWSAQSIWQDNPQQSLSSVSDSQTSQRLGSLFSSKRWQMQHEHLLQNVSCEERTALQAEFLQVQVLANTVSWRNSPFLGCFLRSEKIELFEEDIFFCSMFLHPLMVCVLDISSITLCFNEPDCIFSLSRLTQFVCFFV